MVTFALDGNEFIRNTETQFIDAIPFFLAAVRWRRLIILLFILVDHVLNSHDLSDPLTIDTREKFDADQYWGVKGSSV